MTDEAKALVEHMRETIREWERDEPRDDWWLHQHDHSAAADLIEELDRHLTLSGKVSKALSERIEALEAENERLLDIDEVKAKAIDNLLNQLANAEQENERLRGMLKPQWFYAGEDQSSDQCRFSIDEVLEDELCGWGAPKTGKHVVHVSTALPGPDIWVAVHVFTDEEKDARDDDETWNFQEFSTEEEARAALAGDSHDQ